MPHLPVIQHPCRTFEPRPFARCKHHNHCIGAAAGGGKAAAAALRTSSKQPRLSARPPLSHCTESEFLDDVCTYLGERKGAHNPSCAEHHNGTRAQDLT